MRETQLTGVHRNPLTERSRRNLLKAAGVGTGIVLGTGTGTADKALDSDSTVQTPTDDPVVTTFTATAATGTVAVDTDDPTDATEFSAETLPDDREYVVAFEGELLRSGAWRVSEISLPTLNTILQTLDLQAMALSYVEHLDIAERIEQTEIDPLLSGVISVVETIDFTVEQAETIRALLNEILEGVLRIPGVIGLVEDVANVSIVTVLTEPTVRDFRFLIGGVIDALDLLGGGLSTEEATDELSVSELQPTDDLTFAELVDTLLELIDLDRAALEAELISLVAELDNEDILELLSLLHLELESGPVTGGFDPRLADPALVTVPVPTVTLAAGVGVDDLPISIDLGESDLPLSPTVTTGESGTLTGDIELEGDTAELTLVDNEFTANLDELDIEQLLTELGVGEILELAVEFGLLDIEELLEGLLAEFGVDPDEFLADIDFAAVVGALNLPGIVGRLGIAEFATDRITDEPGRHLLTFDCTVEFDETPDMDAIAAKLPGPVGDSEFPPRDLDGDGLLENVDGSGELSVADVQLLFANLDSERVQANASQFNFAGANDQRVSVFDVQALFTSVQR